MSGKISRYASQNAQLKNHVTQLSQSYEELEQRHEMGRKRNEWLAAKMKEQFRLSFPDETCDPGPHAHPRDDFSPDGGAGSANALQIRSISY